MLRGRLAACAAAVLLGACAGPGYYWQAVSGHLELMAAREDIDTLLHDAAPGDPLAKDLHLAREILGFAAAELALPVGDAYGSYAATGREAVVWNVVATPEFSLAPKRWCFPVSGCVPYRGYFERAAAERAAARLRARHLDVAVSPATAYSTLGWFEDPVLDTMFAGGPAALAGTLFHELAHRRSYARGDTAFNESYARFVELEGVAAWLSTRGMTEAADHWRRRRQLSDAFLELLADARSALGALYDRGGEPAELRREKAAILAGLEANYRRAFTDPDTGTGPWDGYFEPPPNNADLALVAQYEDGRCAFAALFRAHGGDWREFHAAVESIAGGDEAARRDWLARDC